MKPILPYLAIAFLYFNSCDMNNDKARNQENTSISPTMDTGNFKSGYSDVNGIRMYYEAHGDQGDYLVLIHGGGSTIGTSFSRIIPLLAKEHKVITVELQAHGHTGDRNSPESFEQDADDVATLLHNLQILKASFFGFSNGGNTAMQIAIRHPGIVNKLVIALAFYKREGMQPGFFDGMQHATINHMPQELKTAFLQINPDTNALLNMFNKDRERMLNFRDWKDETLTSIKAPSLIICGDHDVVTTAHTVAMSKLIANSRLTILPATHGAYMGVAESPTVDDKILEVTAKIVEGFLKGKSTM